MRGAHVLIRGGQIRPDQPVFDERDWTDRSGTGISGYIKSKALAKQAVWDFIEPERKDRHRSPRAAERLQFLASLGAGAGRQGLDVRASGVRWAVMARGPALVR